MSRTPPLTPQQAQRVMIAYHEVGHALASLCWIGPIKSVTIVPTAQNHGIMARATSYDHTQAHRLPLDVRHAMGRSHIRVSLAGLAAEEVATGRRVAELDDVTRIGGTRDVSDFPEDDDLGHVATWLRVTYRSRRNEQRRARVLKEYEVTLRFLHAHRALLDDAMVALLRRKTLDGRALLTIVADHHKRKPCGWNPSPWQLRVRTRPPTLR
jgi:ATP-dependent Zn protease